LTTNPENPEIQQSPARQSDESATGSPPENESFTFSQVFIGPDGLRAGWSLLIFICLVVAFVYATNIIGRKLLASAPKPSPDTPLSLQFGIITELLPFLALLFISWVMSKIEKRSTSAYGFGGTHKLRNFLAGLGWGVTCLSLLVLTLWQAGLLVFDRRLLFGLEIARRGLLWLFGFLLVGLLEEYLSRGYLQYTLTRGLAGIYKWAFKSPHSKAMGFWTSAAVFSVLFGLGHQANPGESPIGLLAAGLVGMVFCLSLWRTGSLWWAVGFHAAWDWAQSFLYGVADSGLMIQHHLFATHPVGKPLLSGGGTGPEGSIFVIGILAIVVLIIFFTLPDANKAEAPAQ
jgi:membrane protease YdiL (CAAX protease family)